MRERARRSNVVTTELGYVRPRLLSGTPLSPGAKVGPMPVSAKSGAALALFIDARHLGETYKRALAVYRECRETGKWPGYSDGVNFIGLPPWMQKELEMAA